MSLFSADEIRAQLRAQKIPEHLIERAIRERADAREMRRDVGRETAAGAPPKTKRRSPERVDEHHIQRALFVRVNDPTEQQRRPALALVHAVPNGASASSPAAAGRRKAEGQKPGVPDVNCPCARGGYHGLWIEMKKPGGTTSPEQAHWLAALAREGYKTALHTTAEGAWWELLAYLDEPRTDVFPVRPSPEQGASAR